MKLGQAASYVSISFDLERTSTLYTGQDNATMIALKSMKRPLTMGATFRIVALFNHGCH